MSQSSNNMLERMEELAGRLKLEHLRPQFEACRAVRQAADRVDVAVLGRFKAGKSSFLNNLAGRAVLPIGVVPLTAVITRLRYGPVEQAEVRFLDGSVRAVPLADIGLYVSETENPNNSRHVASVTAELPELERLAPLEFVDTPGLGSAFVHNTEAALNWLPNVGAALVAVSADAPLSERDMALIETLRSHTPKIVILLTKADLLTPPQRVEVLSFVQRQLRSKWGVEYPVFFYSVRPQEAGLKAEFEQNFLEPLRRQRREVAWEIAHHKTLSLARQLRNYMEVALAAATQAESAREALRQKLAEERLQFDLLRSELRVFAQQWSAQALDWSLAQLQPVQAALQEKMTAELETQLPRWKQRLPRLLDEWRKWLDASLRSELGQISRSQREMFCTPMQRARLHLLRMLHAFHDRLAGHARAALGVSLVPREFTLEIAEPAAPPVDVAYAFDAAFTSLSWLVPVTIFRSLVKRALIRKTKWEVEKNISRLAADWRERVADGIQELVCQAEKQALDELDVMEQMLAQKSSPVDELRQAAEWLRQY